MSVTRAAHGIHEVVNENMATAARMHASEQGLDVRGSALVAFGGAGPIHAYRVAKLLGINRVVCPLGAGVMSSIGMLVAPKSFDSVQSYISRLDSVDWDHVSSIYETMESSAVELLTAAGVEAEDIRMERSADMRYVGQGFEIVVPVPSGKLGPGLQEALAATFSETYESLFGRILSDVPVETITWRLSASEPPPRPDIRFRTVGPETHGGGLKGERPVFLTEEGRFVDCPVLDRYGLEPGATVSGPAIVEERESTVFVGPDARCRHRRAPEPGDVSGVGRGPGGVQANPAARSAGLPSGLGDGLRRNLFRIAPLLFHVVAGRPDLMEASIWRSSGDVNGWKWPLPGGVGTGVRWRRQEGRMGSRRVGARGRLCAGTTGTGWSRVIRRLCAHKFFLSIGSPWAGYLSEVGPAFGKAWESSAGVGPPSRPMARRTVSVSHPAQRLRLLPRSL